MLEISTNKIARIIVRARELEAKVGRWDRPGDEAGAESILENRPGDGTEAELRSYISDLNADEKASLIAVMWIGRDTFDAAELQEAIAQAKAEAISPVDRYLLGTPLLSDYLESGLEALGYCVEEVEEGFL